MFGALPVPIKLTIVDDVTLPLRAERWQVNDKDVLLALSPGAGELLS